MPPTYATRFGGAACLPAPLAAIVDGMRATRAGAFAMRVYEAYR